MREFTIRILEHEPVLDLRVGDHIKIDGMKWEVTSLYIRRGKQKYVLDSEFMTGLEIYADELIESVRTLNR